MAALFSTAESKIQAVGREEFDGLTARFPLALPHITLKRPGFSGGSNL